MKVCVLMWYDSSISDYGDFNYKTNMIYCKKYNIEIIKCSEKRYKERHPAWERIPVILKYINDYDYVIWIDADAHFHIDSKNIIDFISKNKNHDIIFSQDKSVIINTGIFIIKNSKYSIDFLNEWGYNDELYINNPYPLWWDNGVIIDMYNKNILNIQNNSTIINYGILQHFFKDELNQFIEKPFIFHLAGRDKKTRLNESFDYYTNYKKIIECFNLQKGKNLIDSH